MAKKNKGINIFRQVPKANLPSTTFNMSHQVKFSGEFGKAYPFFCQEVIAGDTWDVSVDHFARLAPMVAPVMHDLDVRMHWFYVPMRLLWDDFEDWITGGRTGTWREENPDAFPVLRLDALYGLGYQESDELNGSLLDFLGVNFAKNVALDEVGGLYYINAMPFRAYWMIFNYFFRDQNVEDEIEVRTTGGVDSNYGINDLRNMTLFGRDMLFRVAWDKDYFTSATLAPQRGPQVYVPIGSSAPVVVSNPETPSVEVRYGGASIPDDLDLGLSSGAGNNRDIVGTNGTTTGPVGLFGRINEGTLSADLASSSGAAVDDVREAFALQRFFERMQVVGSRFSEYLRGIFGTNAGDARLQMPEYLGTWQNPFIINNVSQTSSTTSDSPQAGYAGNGMASQRNESIRKYFPEPGYLIGLYVAMPRNGYFQGLNKMLTRTDWLDFFNPYFEHIGEQPIMTSELFFDITKAPASDTVFGYQSQYASYKFINSHIHGEFKNTLDFWTAARKFDSAPTLSDTFVYYQPEESTDRLFQLPEEPKFYVQLDVKAYATRPMSAMSTPRIV